jgi:two-component system, OmpR family, KDP operon response regulator KdpE
MVPGARILVVDDEPQIHRFLQPALESAGYQVERAEDAAEGLRLAAARAPDLVLLDLGLPDLDGQAVLSRLRAFSRVPVIVLSARDRETEKIAALDAGADDYVEKPFGLGELLAWIRGALRRALAQEGVPELFSYGGLEVDLERRQVRMNGEPVALSPREYALLALLVCNAGRIVKSSLPYGVRRMSMTCSICVSMSAICGRSWEQKARDWWRQSQASATGCRIARGRSQTSRLEPKRPLSRFRWRDMNAL